MVDQNSYRTEKDAGGVSFNRGFVRLDDGTYVPRMVPVDGTGAPVTPASGADIGTDGASPPTLPGGATGVRGWLRYIASILTGTLIHQRRQNSVAQVAVAMANSVPGTLMTADATRTGAAILNWMASPIYLTLGASGTPGPDAPSLYVPAASSGVPGQFIFDHAPVDAYRYFTVGTGNVTLITW